MTIGDTEYVAVSRTLALNLTGDGATVRRQGVPDRDHPALADRAAALPERDAHRAARHGGRRRARRRRCSATAIARTVTRPLGRDHRDDARDGRDRRPDAADPAAADGRWEDEDARLLATTFNTLTDSIARFQREAAQRERLSSLGRLSTVIAHEIRNPLMIIKAALRALRAAERRPGASCATAVADIDEEITRLNRIVNEVLDFARPIQFDLAPADLNALCDDAAKAVSVDTTLAVTRRSRPRSLRPVTHRRRAAAARAGQHPDATPGRRSMARRGRAAARAPIRLKTAADSAPSGSPIDGRATAASASLPRTCRGSSIRTSRPADRHRHSAWRSRSNIVEGLGGTIAVAQPAGRGHRGPDRAADAPVLDWQQRARMTNDHNGSILLVDDEEKILQRAGARCASEGHEVRRDRQPARGAAAARRSGIVRRARRRQPDAGADRPRPDPRARRRRRPSASGRRS